jgi:hypothetical protein
MMCAAIYFDNGSTFFDGSYTQLRDKPTIPTSGGSVPAWVKETQNLVALSGFNKDLTWADVLSKPSWITAIQSSIPLTGFNKNLAWTDIVSRPSWLSSTQSIINLSGFNKDLTWADVLSKPSWITASQSSINLSGFNRDLTWSHVLSKPTWLQFFQDIIPLSGFYKDLTYADLQNPPGWMTHLHYTQGFYFGGAQWRHLEFAMDIFPKTDLAYQCGSVALRWASVYANNFYGANYLPSDASLKKDVVPAARSGLADIEALQVVDFTWKADGKSDTGLIAQQAREVNPVFYHESAGIGNIAQYPLIIALVKSVQELSERIKVLENAAVH